MTTKPCSSCEERRQALIRAGIAMKRGDVSIAGQEITAVTISSIQDLRNMLFCRPGVSSKNDND